MCDGNEDGQVMLKRWMIPLILLVAALLLWSGSQAVVTARPTTETLEAMSPVQVTADYYAWYLDYLSAGVLCNPLLDGAYQDSPYLTAGYISRLDALVSDSCGVGLPVDPFLCGTAVPQAIVARHLSADETSARVAIYARVPTESSVAEMTPLGTASLVQVAGQWQLDAITCR